MKKREKEKVVDTMLAWQHLSSDKTRVQKLKDDDEYACEHKNTMPHLHMTGINFA